MHDNIPSHSAKPIVGQLTSHKKKKKTDFKDPHK